MKIAIVGATGLVGSKMITILEERNFPVSEFIPVASEKSLGKYVTFKNKKYQVVAIQDAVDSKPDIAIFSAGADASKAWAPKFAAVGCRVIDNSSAWRMNENIKLIVPEINGNTIEETDMIIANPNCSTIQLVMVAAPLHRQFKIERIIVSTYQSVTGSGVKAIQQLLNEQKGAAVEKAYPHQIHMNCIPQCDVFLDNGFTKEEMKMVNETRKILHEPDLKVTSTAVRVPVVGGHSESVYLEFENNFELNQVEHILADSPGISVKDERLRNVYPMPINATGSDLVFVGRIRRDLANEKALNLWIVADNLRKGAATNAIQIAEILLANFLVNKSDHG
jgi:aspartate-semialdehyde dehydrogenase